MAHAKIEAEAELAISRSSAAAEIAELKGRLGAAEASWRYFVLKLGLLVLMVPSALALPMYLRRQQLRDEGGEW